MLIYQPDEDEEGEADNVQRVIEYMKCDMSDKILEDNYVRVDPKKVKIDNSLFSRHFVITN